MTTTAIVAPSVNYPEPSFAIWQTEIPPEQRLEVVSSGGFPIEDALKVLKLNDSPLAPSFGICDLSEIRGRLEVMRWLGEHPQVQDWLLAADWEKDLPSEQQEFMKFYDPVQAHNPHWQKIHEFLALCEACGPLPPRIQRLVETLQESLQLESPEREMATRVAARLQRVAYIEGLMHFKIKLERRLGEDVGQAAFYSVTLEDNAHDFGSMSGDEVFGYSKYSFGLSRALEIQPPAWTKKKKSILRYIGLSGFMKAAYSLMRWRKVRKACKPLVITGMDIAMRRDVTRGLSQIFRSLKMQDYAAEGATVSVNFRYDEGGLQLLVYAISAEVNRRSFTPDEKVLRDFAGFTGLKFLRLKWARQYYDKIVRRHIECLQQGLPSVQISKQDPDFFRTFKKVNSPHMDSYYAWFCVTNVYAESEFTHLHEALVKNRQWCAGHFTVLCQMAKLSKNIHHLAAELGSPVCYPEIRDNGHVVAFDEILPVHLLPQKPASALVAVGDLPAINGQLIGLTGYHGGGKTVTTLTVPVAIYLAQSGLPVLASSFSLNVKKMLGMVFIERGKGSTCELLVGSLRDVLKVAFKYAGNEVVLVLDELGSATQEDDGFQLGHDILGEISHRHISALFSTQIQRLATSARDDFGADIFQLDEQHRILPGIGDGGMHRLRNRLGLDKVLQS